jgi:FtsP/CotA-like multicopper oxidase with cupredoxin domain
MLVDLDSISSKDGLLRATLTVDERNVTIGAQTVQALTYNGEFLGPTLRVHPGDTMELTLQNCISETTNLHFHGMNVSPNGLADNIFRAIDPGQAAPYVLRSRPNRPPAPTGITTTCTACRRLTCRGAYLV